MKICHAAAFALVGWYLMIPPLVNAPYKIDSEAPLRDWKVYRKFDTAHKCEDSLAVAKAKYEQTASAPLGSIKKGTRAFALQMTFGQCVKADLQHFTDPATRSNSPS